jgi:uncharacterized protein (DUF983 family)
MSRRGKIVRCPRCGNARYNCMDHPHTNDTSCSRCGVSFTSNDTKDTDKGGTCCVILIGMLVVIAVVILTILKLGVDFLQWAWS